MNATNTIKSYRELIKDAIPYSLAESSLSYGTKYRGKVRDCYDLGDRLILLTTDRLSAFDRHLANIPYKGQVLNLVSAWWFQQTEHIVPNHVIAVPDPNVLIAKKCTVFPIEFVVRGYITGTTSTALWTQYQSGVRNYCGVQFPEGLRKNQQLVEPVITPTTKDKVHDRPISPSEIVADGFMTQADWDEASQLALTLFKFGTLKAKEHGLILVDTKYELGRDADGKMVLVDEIHTPDSSRYWLAHSYESLLAQGAEPENIDKEFLRLWFAKNCNPYEDKTLPAAPEELVITLAERYVQLYETITGNRFSFGNPQEEREARIKRNLAGYLG